MNQYSDDPSGVQLERFYLKDIQRFRDFTEQYYPPRSLAAWRRTVKSRLDAGEQMFYVLKENEIVGGVDVAAPFDSLTWRMARVWTKEPLTREELKGIARQIIGDDEVLYRVDLLCSSYVKKDLTYVRDIFDIDLEATLNTFFAPEVSLRQVGFIPWNYGYLAMVTTPDCEKIESIQFFRKGAAGLTTLVKQTAYFRGLLGFNGIIPGKEDPAMDEECEILKLARQELNRYLEGGHEPSIPYVFPEGTEFQQHVWQKTLEIPFAVVRTYAEIAEQIQPDKEKSGQLARAVGRALAANPLPIIIPCHRVIGANRELVGFGGGVDMKDYLLQLEMWYAGPVS